MLTRPADSRLSPTRLPWVLIGIFLVLLGALFFARIYSNNQSRARAEASTYDQLSLIASLKQEQINTWLETHQKTARLLSAAAKYTDEFRALLVNPQETDILGAATEQLDTIRATYGYEEVIIASSDGTAIVLSPGENRSLSHNELLGVQKAANSSQISFSDIYLDQEGTEILDIYAPLRVTDSESGQAPLVLILRIDPAGSLFPLVESWPNPENTSDTLLIRKEGQQALLLNQPVFSSSKPLTDSFPLSNSALITSQAVVLKDGTGSGVDYRGKQVFFSSRQIPAAGWIVIVKKDQVEVFSPLQQQDNLVSLLTVALFLAAMLAAVLITRQREVQYYKDLYLAEVQRQALTEHLLYLSRYANDIILLTDSNGSILEANDRAAAAYGYSSEDLHKRNLYDLSDEESRIDLLHQIKSVDSQGGLVFEAVHIRSDGTTFPVECSTRIIDVNGKKFYQSILRDITERKQAEELLRQSERRFRLFYEQAPICYQSLDQDGLITDVNHAWESTFRYRRQDVICKPFIDIVTENSRPAWRTALEDFRSSGELRGCEVEMHCADRKRLIVSITGKISYDDHQHIQLLHCVLNDVTEQRLASAQIQRMNEELEKRVLDRTAQLEAANKELEAFSYSVSHDLRAPLRAIDGFTRIVIDDYAAEIKEDAARYLNLVRDNAHTMSSLIDNLLTFSRLSRHPLKKQRIDPNELVKEALQVLTACQADRQIEYMLHPLPGCDADPLLLKQVFINLLSNAIKFTGKKPVAMIEVGFFQEKMETIYYVKDNGIGFDMQYAPKLFGVFQRLHRVEDYEGSGVGLAIVQRIIHRHGGRVWAMGEVDHGATFCFTLEEVNHND